MLTQLQIRDLAIVSAQELELSPGLTVLTGETGAGKSILVGALGLLAGARAVVVPSVYEGFGLAVACDITIAADDRDHLVDLVERHRGATSARAFRERPSAGVVDDHVLRYRRLRVRRLYHRGARTGEKQSRGHEPA